jgi:hypothetical protein
MILRVGIFAARYIQVVIVSKLQISEMLKGGEPERKRKCPGYGNLLVCVCVCLSRGSSSSIGFWTKSAAGRFNEFFPATYFSSRQRQPRKGIFSHTCLQVQTPVNSAVEQNKPELRARRIHWLAGRSRFLSTSNKRHLVPQPDYKDGSSRGNAAQAIGGTRVAPQEKICKPR